MPAYKDKKNGTWYAKFYYTNWVGEKNKSGKEVLPQKKKPCSMNVIFLNAKQEVPI